MKVYNYPMPPLPGTVLNTTVYGPAMQLYNMYGYAIQVVWSGTPTGTWKLQASSDPVPQGSSSQPLTNYQPTHWSDITDSPFSVTIAGDYMWNVYDVMYNWVRLVYTDTSGGTSTARITDATFNGKGF
jgi:hypothetical protein